MCGMAVACIVPRIFPQAVSMKSDFTYKVIKLIERNPEISQRELSRELGISLGKTNYCVKALMDKGWIKARNFKNSQNKLAYSYLLTPKGMREKTNVASQFLKRKLVEYDALQREIESLRKEVAEMSPAEQHELN